MEGCLKTFLPLNNCPTQGELEKSYKLQFIHLYKRDIIAYSKRDIKENNLCLIPII